MFNGLSTKRKTRKQDVSYWLKPQAFDVIPNGYVTTTYIFKVLNEANTVVDLPLFFTDTISEDCGKYKPAKFKIRYWPSNEQVVCIWLTFLWLLSGQCICLIILGIHCDLGSDPTRTSCCAGSQSSDGMLNGDAGRKNPKRRGINLTLFYWLPLKFAVSRLLCPPLQPCSHNQS